MSKPSDNPDLVSIRRWIAWGTVLITCTALYFAASVLIPVAVAIFVAILLDPIVTRLEMRGHGRTPLTVVTMFCFFAAISVVLWLFYVAVSVNLEQLSDFVPRVQALYAQFTGKKLPAPIHSQSWTSFAAQQAYQWREWIFQTLGSTFEIVSLALFVPLLVFYFLCDKSNTLESVNTVSGRFFQLPKLNQEITSMVHAFFRGNLAGGAVLVALHALCFYALGLKGAAGLALLSGFLNLIPLLGSPLALIFPLAQALMQWPTSDAWPFLILVAAIVSFHFVVGNIVLPAMIGSKVNVNSATLAIGLLFWGWLWGPVGFLIGIPLTAVLKIALECSPHGYTLANLMAVKPRYVIGWDPRGLRARKKALPSAPIHTESPLNI